MWTTYKQQPMEESIESPRTRITVVSELPDGGPGN